MYLAVETQNSFLTLVRLSLVSSTSAAGEEEKNKKGICHTEIVNQISESDLNRVSTKSVI